MVKCYSMALEETPTDIEENTKALLVNESTLIFDEREEQKRFTHLGLWFSVFYYSTFQVIGSVISVGLSLLLMVVGFIEVDGDGQIDPESTNVIITLLIVNLLAIIAIGFITVTLNKRMKHISSKVSFKLNKEDWKVFGFGLAVMFFVVGGIQLLISVIQTNFFPDLVVETPYDFFNSNNIGVLIFATFVVSFGAPIVEELFYRWAMIDTLKKGMNKFATIIFASLIFAFAHSAADLSYSFYYFIIHFIGTFLIGLILGAIYLQTKKVLLTIFLHSIWNLVIAIGALFDNFGIYNIYTIIYLVIVSLAGIGTIASALLIYKNQKQSKDSAAILDSSNSQEKTKIQLRPEWFTLILGYFGLIVLVPLLINLIIGHYTSLDEFIMVIYLGILMVLSIVLITTQKYQNQMKQPEEKLEL